MSCATNFFTKLATDLGATPGDLADLQFNMNNLVTSYQANETDFDLVVPVKDEIEEIVSTNIDKRFVEQSFVRASCAFVIALVYCVVITLAISYDSIEMILFIALITTALCILALFFLLRKSSSSFEVDELLARDIVTYESLKQNQLTAGVCAY